MISASGQDTLTFKVKGLVCSFCAHGLNKGIGKLRFTDEKSVWVDIENQIVKVAVNKDFIADPHLKQTIELIKETGYEVDKVFLNEMNFEYLNQLQKQESVTKNGFKETVINNNNKEMKWQKNKIKKKKVWKADFDGNLDLSTDDVKKAIDWHSAVLKGY